MTRIDVFDPPLCCSSGVCGPSVDPLVAAFAADVQWLGQQGVEVVRHNLAQVPQDFVSTGIVHDLLSLEGEACLPIVLVNGDVLQRGAYPRRDALAQAAGVQAASSTTKPRLKLSAVANGCTPGSGCC
jgi:hypothetical protein